MINLPVVKPKCGVVYVIGAGFSMALGYPLVNDLLIRLWEWNKFPKTLQDRLAKVIKFHHPGFNPSRRTSFPNIEQLLSEMMVNEDLFNASRSSPGGFTRDELTSIRSELLLSMSMWFHSIGSSINLKSECPEWLKKFKSMLRPEDTIISFNWDLVLEQLLFGAKLDASSYGFGPRNFKLPLILKPHGSLNWFHLESGGRLKPDKKFLLKPELGESFYVFTRYRQPKSKAGHDYMPVIIPPILNKSFQQGVQWETWRYSVASLSVAERVVFLGYSMPDADLHGRFIMQCGFHNQLDGVLKKDGKRSVPTTAASVTIVNPDRSAAARIESVAGAFNECVWEPMGVQLWVENY